MVRTINEVLSPAEIEELKEIEAQVDLSKARIIVNVMHIDCEMPKGGVEVTAYLSLKNPYELIIPQRKQTPKEISEKTVLERNKEMFMRRMGHKLEFRGRRHETLAYEIRVREEEITAHKWYLSDLADEDAGLLVASAHWLKEHSADFCARQKLHYMMMDVDFEMKGLEKAVVITAPDKKGRTTYCVLAMTGDLMTEENMAQYATGVATDKNFYEKAGALRKKLIEAEKASHFCILHER